MSEPLATHIEIGKLVGTTYDFAVAGDTLPTHRHSEDDCHITICRKGRVRAFGPGWERVLGPGDVVKFEPHVDHGIEALDDASQITNIRY